MTKVKEEALLRRIKTQHRKHLETKQGLQVELVAIEVKIDVYDELLAEMREGGKSSKIGGKRVRH